MNIVKNASHLCVAVTLSILAQPASAQELNDLNLPTSGLTENGLRSQDELLARMVQLTTCAECSVIIGGTTYFGSDDNIELGAAGVSVILNGYFVRFESFVLDGSN